MTTSSVAVGTTRLSLGEHAPKHAPAAIVDRAYQDGRLAGLSEASKEAHAEMLARPALGAIQGAAITADAEPEMFNRWSIKEMIAEPDEFEWLAKGLLCWPTYGMLAGEMKTLKSYLAGFITVGIAANQPILGRFGSPADAGYSPVLSYVGEGGRRLYKRRLERIAQAMNVTLAELPIHASFDTAPVLSGMFADSLRRDLEDIDPALVIIDPYYAYHGAQIKAADLHAEATILNAISRPCLEANADLLVVNHFNQSGGGTGLKRITMAGGAEWSDSWILLEHREDPDIDNGTFHLTMNVGSRQWGGSSWELDIDIGRFDEDTGTHDGQISWDIRKSHKTGNKTSDSANPKAQAARTAILEVLSDKPWQLTKTEVYERIGGAKSTFTMALNALAEDGLIAHNLLARKEAGIDKKRPLWGPATNPDQSEQSRFTNSRSADAF